MIKRKPSLKDKIYGDKLVSKPEPTIEKVVKLPVKKKTK